MATDQVKLHRIGFQQCTKCRRIKSLASFSRDRRRKCGRQARCKLCDRRRALAYFHAHRQAAEATHRRWLKNNRVRRIAYMRRWRAKNRAHLRAAHRAYRALNGAV